jgi:hypothetical protein
MLATWKTATPRQTFDNLAFHGAGGGRIILPVRFAFQG